MSDLCYLENNMTDLKESKADAMCCCLFAKKSHGMLTDVNLIIISVCLLVHTWRWWGGGREGRYPSFWH